jgi:lipid II:glycine glycyltransferase (peptidoglycan interpeptide bridge formation enzyme)
MSSWSKGFPSKLRSQVRRAQKEGMTARVGGNECLDEFYTVFSRCMRDLGTPVYAKGFFAKILEVFPKETRICIVSHGETPVAAGFLYGFRSSLEIPWAASDKRFNKLAPKYVALRHGVGICLPDRAFRSLTLAVRVPTAEPIDSRSNGELSHTSCIGTIG